MRFHPEICGDCGDAPCSHNQCIALSSYSLCFRTAIVSYKGTQLLNCLQVVMVLESIGIEVESIDEFFRTVECKL